MLTSSNEAFFKEAFRNYKSQKNPAAYLQQFKDENPNDYEAFLDWLSTQLALEDETDLKERITKAKKHYQKVFNAAEPEIIIRSPGRAEIIGSHTDYNRGFALSAAISRSTIGLFNKRSDSTIRIYSTNYPDTGPLEFDLHHIEYSKDTLWINYAKGVLLELLKRGHELNGADIFIDSNVPDSGGVSSSAALEITFALGLNHLYRLNINKLDMAFLCQHAENIFVGSPCGILDQSSVALCKREHLLFIDFQPGPNLPITTDLIQTNLNYHSAAFIIAVDTKVKRNLGQTGYPERRLMCEESLYFWKKHLGQDIESLRDITVKNFTKFEEELRQLNPTMHKRVKHIVYENKRVLDAVVALRSGQIGVFGKLLTDSGISALELYDLDSGVPELSFLVSQARMLSGVYGARNMGGGFSANIIALINKAEIDNFRKALQNAYQKQFPKGNLDFLLFNLSSGAERLNYL